jgi:RNA polymerase sigma-70 factor, ECF subfamily
MTSEAASQFLANLGGESRIMGAEGPSPQILANGVLSKVINASGTRESFADETGLVAESSDEILLQQLCEGDKEALAILFRRYARMVRAVGYRILRDASEADDLLQEVFLFIFRKSALFDAARGSARSWIVQVTYHRAIDRRRHLAARHFYTSVEIDDDSLGVREPRAEIAFYEQSMEGMLGKRMLRRMDESLSEEQRRVIQLYFFEGYTLEEIAAKVGQALGNIRNHYYRGLEKMRQQIFPSKLRPK